jgi:hypothetical protein
MRRRIHTNWGYRGHITGWCLSPQKRPTRVKRGLHMCQKRPTHVSKETYTCVKRDLRMCQKRPTHVSKETYTCLRESAVLKTFFLGLQTFVLGNVFWYFEYFSEFVPWSPRKKHRRWHSTTAITRGPAASRALQYIRNTLGTPQQR